MGPCKGIDSRRLAAWVDNEMGSAPEMGQNSAQAVENIAAHVAACPVCAPQAAELRRHREQMRRYRAATTPDTLPPHFWSVLRTGLDRQDKAAEAPRLRIPRKAVSLRSAAIFAGILLICVGFLSLTALRPAHFVPVAQLLHRPVMPLPGDRTLVTGDSDLAARWLSKKLGQEVPTVSLALIGAPLVQAQADTRGNTGLLLFRSAQGIPLALHIFLHARVDTGRTRPVPYDGHVYQMAVVRGAPNTLVLWESDGCAFAAVAPLSPQELLPYVHEMSRRCLPGQ